MIGAEVRFWRHVQKADSGCWIWTAALDRKGYGRFRASGTATQAGMVFAHRFSYELQHGYIPDLPLDHLCRTPACVNPNHLEPVTASENLMRRWNEHGPSAVVCQNGHTRPDGAPRGRGQGCQACRSARQRSRYGQKKVATS